jgi:hypothetical protein
VFAIPGCENGAIKGYAKGARSRQDFRPSLI